MSESGRRRVVLIGNPNSGKSTLFNALTGLSVRTANYAGVTIEKKSGQLDYENQSLELIDLPGTYSLAARSLDEQVAVNVLKGGPPENVLPDLIVCVVNSTLLRRHLFLVTQLQELPSRLVIALNMSDAARDRGIVIDIPQLSAKLGVPVVAVSATKREGLNELCRVIATEANRTAQHENPQTSRYGNANGLVIEPIDEALLAKDCQRRYAQASRLIDGVITAAGAASHATTDRIDRWLTHRFWGYVCFFAIMFLIFQFIFAWAAVPMDAIEAGQGYVAGLVETAMSPSVLRSLIVDGMIAGVGGVLVFVPQIALLFFFLAILEDCGYMSRAAFLIDRVMRIFGLSGKSFLPLMSSFACAIPGIMGARTIDQPGERLATIFIAPLMSCSARLPVYLLLIAAFFPAGGWLGGWLSISGVVLLAMYLIGVVVAIPTAWVLQKTILRGQTAPLLLELPDYRWPDWRVVLMKVYQASAAFIVRAGTLILAASIVIWATGYFPGDHSHQHALQKQIIATAVIDEAEVGKLQAELNAENANLLESSYLGRAGHFIEPLVKPLGWDWKIGVGALASFPAREVIIATLGTIYSLGGDVDESDEGLKSAMQSATWPDGKPVYTIAVALSVMVFFALCAQCVSTLLVMKKETNSWRWPLASFVYMTTLAYLGAFVTYQIASRIGY